MQYKTKKRVILWFFILVLIILYFFKNWSLFLTTIGAIVTLIMFYYIDSLFDIQFKLRHYIFLILMIVAGFLLFPLYEVYSYYDKIQHFLTPLLGSVMVFYAINKTKIDFKWKILITFSTIVCLVSLWEIGEYLGDVLFNFNFQGVFVKEIVEGLERLNIVQSRIDDTMIDMMLGVFGSLVFITGQTIYFFYNRKFGKKTKS